MPGLFVKLDGRTFELLAFAEIFSIFNFLCDFKIFEYQKNFRKLNMNQICINKQYI